MGGEGRHTDLRRGVSQDGGGVAASRWGRGRRRGARARQADTGGEMRCSTFPETFASGNCAWIA
jgi:hypothetical protein